MDAILRLGGILPLPNVACWSPNCATNFFSCLFLLFFPLFRGHVNFFTNTKKLGESNYRTNERKDKTNTNETQKLWNRSSNR